MTPPSTLTDATVLPGLRPEAAGLDPVLSRPWRRWLIPSLADLFFAALIGWLFMSSAQGWQSLLVDGDIGWHIRTGEYILDHHQVPHQDLYSFSKPGAPWYAWEWLSDVLAALLFRSAGLEGVVLGAGALIAPFGTVLLPRIVDAGGHLFSGPRGRL